MKAWTVTSLNAPPLLAEVPLAQPKAGEARVLIRACALNFADLLMAEGRYQERPPLPFVPGLEFAGIIDALGPDTKGPALGTRVACFAGSGGMAEAANLPVDRLVPLPDSMSLAEAAAFQIAYGTSHLALSHRARLQPGETLLVLGAAGGVGLTAVELGKLMGARVIASARGAEKLAIAKAAGADHVIDSDAPGLKESLRALGGVDVIYDAVGGPQFDEALRACRPEGRLLCIGFASGSVPQIPANLLLVKNLSVIGLYWGGYLAFAPDILTTSLRRLFDWFAEGRLKPHISHLLPFESFPDGLALLKSRASTGKVVLQIGTCHDA